MKWLVPESNGLLHLIDFGYNPPSVSIPNPNYGYGCGEEVNLMTDEDGNVLFSFAGVNTTTIEVRDANWNIMPNGNGLFGHFSTIESCIIRVPCSESKYYIIHSNKVQYPGNLYYSVVDLNENGGFGDVVRKNIKIGDEYFYEGKVVSHQLPSGCRWLLTTKRSSLDMEIVRYLITDNGIEEQTVIEVLNNCDALELELSPDNTKFALAIRENTSLPTPDVIIFDFDLESGTLSNQNEYHVTDQRVAGVEFSGSSTKLYWRTNTSSNACDLGRINLENGDTHIIDDYIGSYGTGIEMAGNGMIYIAKSTNNNSYGVITNPDAENIVDIGYTRDGLYLSAGGMRSGIPDAIDGEITNAVTTPSYIDFEFTKTDECDEYIFTDFTCLSSWREWDFGDGNLSNLENPLHRYSDPGTYNVTFRVFSCGDTLELSKELISNDIIANLDLGNDTSICEGIPFLLHAGEGFESYEWQDGSNDSIIIVTESGIYWVNVTDSSGCSGSDSVAVEILPLPDISLGLDTAGCIGDTIYLDAGPGYDSYLWQDGSTNQVFCASEGGLYYVTISNYCGSGTDSVYCTFNEVPEVFLGNDTCLVIGDEMYLHAEPGYQSYLWQNGTSGSSILVQDPGSYWVMVSEGNCTGADTILINSCDYSIFFPTGFTPNGDGINDYFKPKYYNIHNYKIYIYNRWGALIFESNDIDTGWDGNYKGRLCPQGVYAFIVYYGKDEQNINDQRFMHKGNLTLIRKP